MLRDKLTYENLLISVIICLVFSAGYLYGGNGKLTKAEIRKVVFAAEERVIIEIKRNRKDIREQELPVVDTDSIQTDNIENLYQIVD